MVARVIGILIALVLMFFQGCAKRETTEKLDTSPLFSNEAWVNFQKAGFTGPQSRRVFLTEQLAMALHSSGRNHLLGDQLSGQEFEALKEVVSLYRPELKSSEDDLLGVTIFIEKYPAGYFNIEVRSDERIFRSNTSVTWVKPKPRK